MRRVLLLVVLLLDLTDATPSTAEQLARRDFFLRATQLPASFVLTDMLFGTIGVGEVVHRRTGGKHALGNTDADYGSPLLSDAEARRLQRRRPPRHRGRVGRALYAEVLPADGPHAIEGAHVHAHDDGLVLVENEDKYRQAFEAAKNTDRLVQLYTPYGGHCGFIAELFPAVSAITAWVEHDEKPSLVSVRAACPGCSFTDALRGPWGLKVVERTQRGAPLGSLVCDGEPNDCPPNATCGSSNHCKRAH